MAEWSKDHVAAICPFKFEHWNLWLMSDKMETRRSQLGGPVEHSEENGRESVVVNLRFLYGSSRLCWLMTEWLVPVSKYWTYRSHAGDMGPVGLVAYHRQMFGFAPVASRLAWERNWVRIHRSINRCDVDCVGSPFSREQWHCSTLSMTCERLSRMGTTPRKHTPCVHGLAWEAYVSCWSGFPLQGVHRFETPWLSDMSNCLFDIPPLSRDG
jgi:hypothetical protein